LWALGLFGFLHGMSEWADIFSQRAGLPLNAAWLDHPDLQSCLAVTPTSGALDTFAHKLALYSVFERSVQCIRGAMAFPSTRRLNLLVWPEIAHA
jgi:hypothetical protein